MTIANLSSTLLRRRALALAALGLTLAFAAGCKKTDTTPDAATEVQAEKAQQQDLTEMISGDAVLSPQAQAALVPKISAPVKKFLVQRGAHVKAGQLLAVLENSDLAAAVTDTKGSLLQAQAGYDTSIQAQIPEDKQKAQLDMEQAKANLDVAKSVVDARKNLLAQGAIPQRDYDTAYAGYVQAKAAYDIADHHLNSLNAVSQKAAIQTAEGGLSSAKGKYQAAAAGLSYSEIRSPIDGVVTDRPLFPGEMAQAGAPILTVMDTSVLIAKVHLAQSQVQGLKLGAAATVTIPGAGEPAKGTISLISPALDAGSTTIEVWIKVPNKSGALKAGTPVHVQIASRTVANALTVPNEAIVTTKSDTPAVMLIGADGVAHTTAIKTGITDGKDTEVTDGLKPGDLVVTTGAYGMDDGTRVKVVAPGAADDDARPAAGDDK
jgi:multidrug efflux pump subunit AcrA (membrane-fusion protein)